MYGPEYMLQTRIVFSKNITGSYTVVLGVFHLLAQE